MRCPFKNPSAAQTALMTTFLGVAMKVTGACPRALRRYVSSALSLPIDRLCISPPAVQVPAGALGGFSREDKRAFLHLLFQLAEAMAETPAADQDLKKISSDQPACDPRSRILADLSAVVFKFN